MKIAAAFLQKPVDAGLTAKEISNLTEMVAGKELVPVEIEATEQECSAMGFISHGFADEVLDFDYKDLNSFVANILNDKNNESDNGYYEFKNQIIFVGYGWQAESDFYKTDELCPEDEDPVFVIFKNGDFAIARYLCNEDGDAWINEKTGDEFSQDNILMWAPGGEVPYSSNHNSRIMDKVNFFHEASWIATQAIKRLFPKGSTTIFAKIAEEFLLKSVALQTIRQYLLSREDYEELLMEAIAEKLGR